MNEFNAEDDELPPGYRSDLALALHADDPQIVLKHLETCCQIEPMSLVTEQGGKVIPIRGFMPWTVEEAKKSKLKSLDNTMYLYLKSCLTDGSPFRKKSLHTCAFAVAAQHGGLRVVELLLSPKFVNSVDAAQRNNQAIHEASRNGHLEIVKLLMNDSRVDPSGGCNIAIYDACSNGHTAVVSLLLSDKRVDPSDQHNRAIHAACQKGYAEIAKLLLRDSRTDPSDNNNGAFRHACRNGHVDIVRLLMNDKRVDPSAEQNEGICQTSRNGHFETVKVLLTDMRVSPSAMKNVAIRQASRNGHFETVKLLLTDGRVDPSAVSNEAIRYACRNGHLKIAKLLLSDVRVDPSAVRNETICVASQNGHLEIVKLLLADVRVDPTCDLNPAFFLACTNKHAKVAKELLNDNRVYPVSNYFLREAIEAAHVDLLTVLLADERVVVSTEHLRLVDNSTHSMRGRVFFQACPRPIWPRVIGNYVSCLSREPGAIRKHLDGLQAETSWKLLLCVMKTFGPIVAARVADVLREICLKWIAYHSVLDTTHTLNK
jgi:ankyrin repeat protein